MDDWLSGADTPAEACEMFVEATQVMGEAKMSLAKWGSNSEAVSGILERESSGRSILTLNPSRCWE